MGLSKPLLQRVPEARRERRINLAFRQRAEEPLGVVACPDLQRLYCLRSSASSRAQRPLRWSFRAWRSSGALIASAV